MTDDAPLAPAAHRVLGLNHVNVTYPEGGLEAALGFYRDLLGLSERERPPGAPASGAWLWLDRERGIELHLSGEEVGAWPSPSGRHLGILVADLDATRARLEAAGCSVEPARRLPQRERFFARDPFGNRVELLSWLIGR